MPREWLIQHRAGTLAEWAAAEASGPVLLAGERAYITDLKLDVVGDGVTKVAGLGAVGSGTYAPLAADWATGKTFIVGQLVVNAGTLYRCTVQHTAGGSFTAGNFTALGGGGGSTVTIDADGTLVVNGTTVEVGTDAEIAAAIAAAVSVKADLASPAFTGNPTAPTPSSGDNDTSIATTAFVAAAVNYNPQSSLYNLKSSAMRRARGALGRAQSGTGHAKIAFVGDSTTQGTGATVGVSDPVVQMRKLLSAKGFPIAGTGPVRAASTTGDARWTVGSGWVTAFQNCISTSTAGSVATFVSDLPGTVVSIRYLNNATGHTFTYAIDGGAAVTVTTTNAQTVGTVTVTGLTNATHTVVITSGNAGDVYVLDVSVHAASGLLLGNFAGGGTSSTNWAAGTYYDNRNAVASWAPDLSIVMVGINDASVVPTANFTANMTTLITTLLASGDVVLCTPYPAANSLMLLTSQATIVAQIVALANSLSLPLVDIGERWGSHAAVSSYGYYSDAGLHPSVLGYADGVRAISSVFGL